MKKQLIMALAVAAAMTTACSKNESTLTQNNILGTPIMMKGSALNAETKAPFVGDIGASNSLTAFIPASLVEGDYSVTYVSGNMIFKGSSAVGYEAGSTGQKVYPSDAATKVYLSGLYPATTWGTLSTTAAFTFTGKDDVMAASEVATSKADADAASYKSLVFDHKLAKLEIIVVAEDAAAAAAWGKINELTLTKNGADTNFANVATVTLKDGSAAFSGNAANWPMYEITGGTTYTDVAFTSKSVDLTTTPTKVAYTMVVPITATGTADYTIALKATRDGASQITKGDIAINLKKKDDAAFTGSTAGNSFAVTLTFKALEIKATASVTKWIEGGDANADVD